MSEIKVNSVKGVGATTAAITINNSDGTCTANLLNNEGHKNFVINGAMQIAQRGRAGGTVDGSAGYRSTDRFKTDIDGSNGRFTHSTVDDVPANLGFRDSAKITVTTTEAQPTSTTAALQFYYMSEIQDVTQLRWGSSNAKTCTLSFYVKGSVTGDYPVWFQWYGASGTNYFYYTSYAINSANTWERKTITLTGPTSGGQLTGFNTTGFRIEWGLGYGSDTETGTLNEWTTSGTRRTPAGHVWLCENASATWFITGVQFEISPVATDFEFIPVMKQYQYCERYYERLDGQGSAMTNGIMGHYNTTSECMFFYHFRTRKRTTPSLEYSALSDLDIEPFDDEPSDLNLFIADMKHMVIRSQNNPTVTKGFAATLCVDTNSGHIAFDAEL
tara:strand:+ start:10383 stop:11543 length:1161 start_codon:yes stop_codon:yes gene_type:complete